MSDTSATVALSGGIPKVSKNNEAVIRDLQRVSRPGCRVYLGRDEIREAQAAARITRTIASVEAEQQRDRKPGPVA